MRKLIMAVLLGSLSPGAAPAASAVNLDSEPRTIAVTEAGNQTEIVIPPGEAVEFCAAGCFVRMPDGDIEVLNGFETIEISGGQGTIR